MSGKDKPETLFTYGSGYSSGDIFVNLRKNKQVSELFISTTDFHIEKEITLPTLNVRGFYDMVAEIVGKTAIEIINTLIREKYISSLQHAGDMGIELHKAELALKYNLNYTQDKDLKLKKF